MENLDEKAGGVSGKILVLEKQKEGKYLAECV